MDDLKATDNPSDDSMLVAPEAAPATEPEQSSDTGTGAEDTNVAPEPSSEEPSLETDERFKDNPSEVYKSYRELESKQAELAKRAKLVEKIAEKADMSPEDLEQYISGQENSAFRPTPVEQHPYQPQQTPAALQDVQQKLSTLEHEVASQKEAQEIESLVHEHPEAAPFAENIKKIGRYETGKSHKDIFESYYKPAIKTGKNAAYKRLDQKERTQVESAQSSSATPIATELNVNDLQGAHKNPAKLKQMQDHLIKTGMLRPEDV